MKTYKNIFFTLLISALTACGSNSESTVGATTITVVPSLGKVTGATIQIFDLENHLLAKGTMTQSEQLTLNLANNWHDGIIIEVSGDTNAQYYDEGMGTMRPFPTGHTLHAINIPFQGKLSVTALTEIIYQRSKHLATGKFTPAIIQQATNETKTAFGQNLTESPLIVPDLISKNTDLPSDEASGIYASVLASWAKHAYSKKLLTMPDCSLTDDCNPLLDMIDNIATDFSDGKLDGMKDNSPIASIFFDATVSNASDTLNKQLLSAKELFLTVAKNKNTSLALANERIGQLLAGSYNLTCAQSTPVISANNLASKLTITNDGSIIAKGPFGSMLLLSGTGSAVIKTVDNKLTFSHSMSDSRVLQSSNAKSTKGLNLGPTFELYNVGSIESKGDGSGTISIDKEKWTCSGFPQANAEKMISSSQLNRWLPDGDYICLDEKPIILHNGVMSLSDRQISFSKSAINSLQESIGYDLIFNHTLTGRESQQYIAILREIMEGTPATGEMRVTFSEDTTITISHSITSNLQYFSVADYEKCVNSTLFTPK